MEQRVLIVREIGLRKANGDETEHVDDQEALQRLQRDACHRFGIERFHQNKGKAEAANNAAKSLDVIGNAESIQGGMKNHHQRRNGR